MSASQFHNINIDAIGRHEALRRQHIPWRAFGNDTALVEEHDTVANRERVVGIMRRQHDPRSLVCKRADARQDFYLIAEIEVVNPEPYKEYVAAAGPVVAAYGGKYLVRGGATEALEGAPPAGRMVIVEFPSMAEAKRFYDSPEYTDVRQRRIENAISRFILVEGPAP